MKNLGNNTKIIITIFFLMLLVSNMYPQSASGEDDGTNSITNGFNKIKNTVNSGVNANLLKNNSCNAYGDYSLLLFIPAIGIVMIVLFLNTLIYALGKILNSKILDQKVKEEYYQTGITIVVIFIIMVMLMATQGASVGLTLFG